MTIEFQIERVPNLFEPNSIMVLSRVADVDALAGVAWLTRGEPPRPARRQALRAACHQIASKLQRYRFYLLACHTAWQPDSRLVRYRKFWTSLETRGVKRPSGREVAAGMREEDNGIRFFSAMDLHLQELEAVIVVLEEEPASHLVALDGSDPALVSQITKRGWEREERGPSTEIMVPVTQAGGFVIWPLGEFDDKEAGMLAIAKPPVCDKL